MDKSVHQRCPERDCQFHGKGWLWLMFVKEVGAPFVNLCGSLKLKKWL